MGFWKTLGTGYTMMFRQFNMKYSNIIPKVFTGSGTGLMMIGSALIARESCKEDVQQTLRDIEKTYQEQIIPVPNEKKATRAKRVFKARIAKGWKHVKVFRKGIIADAAGTALITTGMGISESGRKKAIAGAAAIGAEFAGYRAAVRADLGEEADLKYMTGRKAVNVKEHVDPKTGEVIRETDDGDIVIKKDPSAFRFWFSKETCPSLWFDNRDLCIATLDKVETDLSYQYMATWVHGGALTLNDMRREFGGLRPHKMDVDIGGLYGRVYDENHPETRKLINLHHRDDQDFMNGRTNGCWIIFECDEAPILGRVRKVIRPVDIYD